MMQYTKTLTLIMDRQEKKAVTNWASIWNMVHIWNRLYYYFFSSKQREVRMQKREENGFPETIF